MNRRLILLVGLVTAGTVCGTVGPTLARRPSLAITPPDLGTLAPGERREVAVRLVNSGWRPLRLDPPSADCGCVVTSSRPVTVPLRGEATVYMRVVAPSVPGTTERTLTLRRAGDPDAVWKVPLTVVVDADVWVEGGATAEYELPYRPDAVAPATAFVRHKPHVALGRVESADPGLTAEPLGDADGLLRVACRPTDPTRPVGQTTLRVYTAEGSKVAVEVPAGWRPVPRVRFVPATVQLDPANPAHMKYGQRVDLFFRNGVPEFTVVSRVP